MASSFLDVSGLPLGLRNNNPGNLRPLPGGQKWQGELAPDTRNNFSRFTNVAWGLRAMITDITGDIVTKKQNTIRKLVTAYAPPGDNNNTTAYIAAVAKATGTSPDAVIIVTRANIERLVKAKLSVELGAVHARRVLQSDIDSGFDLLSVTVKKRFSSFDSTSLDAMPLLISGGALLLSYLIFR